MWRCGERDKYRSLITAEVTEKKKQTQKSVYLYLWEALWIEHAHPMSCDITREPQSGNRE